MKNTLFVFVLFITFFACKSQKKNQDSVLEFSSNHPDSLFFTMNKSACLGQCPTYILNVNHSGKATLKGKAFIPNIGDFTGQISPQKLDTIQLMLAEINYFEMEKVYDSPITDVAATMTEFHLNNQHHRIRNRWGGPSELKRLQKYLHSVMLGVEWVETE